MFDSAALDVAIGLALVYLLFALAVSKINEIITSFLGTRYVGLEKAITALIGDDSSSILSTEKVLSHDIVAPFTKAVNGTPRVDGVSFPGKRGVSYLPSRAFSAAVFDLLAAPTPVEILNAISLDSVPAAAQAALAAAKASPTAPNLTTLAGQLADGPVKTAVLQAVVEIDNPPADPLAKARATITALPPTNPARRPLLRMIADAQGERDRFRESIEHWFDDAMDRVSGWYKRYVQKIILVISVVLVVALNVDTINIAQDLWRVPTERAAVVAAAGTQVAAGSGATRTPDQQVRGIEALGLPIGWAPPHKAKAVSTDPRHLPLGASSYLIKLLGMLLSVLALSLGAPFWFDALSKLGSLRQSGPKPAVSS